MTKPAMLAFPAVQDLYAQPRNLDAIFAGGGGVYKNANTTELYGALTFGPVTAKLSYALTDLFGYHDFTSRSDQSTKGSTYAELNGSFDLGPGLTLAPHVGHQTVSHISNASYTDYSATLGKDLGSGLSVGAALARRHWFKAVF